MIGYFSTHQVAGLLGAQALGADAAFSSVCIDSRQCASGALFVALPGARVDGHDFVAQAAAAGAAAALVREPQPVDLPQLVVTDALTALGQLAAANRARFSGPLVGITGSCGKTSTRAMLAAVLAQAGTTLATDGNYNNEIGVPLTLLRLSDTHQYAVVEMGAAGVGHIAYLCSLGKPTVSVLLNAMAAHLDGFGSIEGVVQGKGEIYDGLGPQGVAVVNAEQPWAERWAARAAASGAQRLLFGTRPPAAADGELRVQVYASEVDSDAAAGSHFLLHTPAGQARVKLALPGLHNVANAVAAAAAAHACGLDPAAIARGLATVQPVQGRLAVHQCGGLTVFDDCYNANPGSVRAAIELLGSCAAPTVLVLGTMAELGEQSAELHREMGDFARRHGVSVLVGVGAALRDAVRSFGDDGHCYADCAEAWAARAQWLPSAATVLVKGSRSAGMEQLLAALLAEGDTAC